MKTVIITGASGGLGRYLVSRYIDLDYRVYGLDNNDTELKRLNEKVNSENFFPVLMDITNEDDWDEFRGHLETNSVEIVHLINSAGILQLNPIEKTTLNQWNRIMKINATGTFLSIHKLLKFLVEGTSIVNVSSIASFLGSKDRIAYAASKGAVSALTKAASIELAPKSIRVNSVHPAYIKTNMADIAGEYTNRSYEKMGERIPLYNRISNVEEIGDVIIFLNSKEAGFITGTEIVIDGGQSVN